MGAAHRRTGILHRHIHYLSHTRWLPIDLPRPARAFETGGEIFAPGDALGAFSSLPLPPLTEAGVDRCEDGLNGSFFEAPDSLLACDVVPFSLGDLAPLAVVVAAFSPFSLLSSTTRSWSLLSPSSSSFLSFLASGDRVDDEPGESDVLCKVRLKLSEEDVRTI